MTTIVAPTNINQFTNVPRPTMTAAEFRTAAFTTVAEWQIVIDQFNAVSQQTYQNATAANERATAANASAVAANERATAAGSAATAAAGSAAAAASAATAAGQGAGLPDAPAANYVLVSQSDGTSAFVNPLTQAWLTGKADKDGGVVTRQSTPWLLHNVASGGTVNIDWAVAGVHRIVPAGNLSITFSNIPTGAVASLLEMVCVGFAGKAFGLPTFTPPALWIKPDNTTTTDPLQSGIVWLASPGENRLLMMVENGQVYFKGM